VLDLGCSSGALGAALKERQGAEVVGVELDREYAAAARARLDQVIESNLEVFFEDGGGSGLGTFDCVIAADVLEHLREPWDVWRAAVSLLEPGGTGVISVPNVRYWETLYQVALKGRWPLREDGIFDRDHVRWFTYADAHDMMTGAGLEVTAVARQYRLKPSEWRTAPQARRLAKWPLRPFLVFQYVMAGTRRG
jgi:methionine biosynthesis protein MetW